MIVMEPLGKPRIPEPYIATCSLSAVWFGTGRERCRIAD